MVPDRLRAARAAATMILLGCLVLTGCHGGGGRPTGSSPTVEASNTVQVAFAHTATGALMEKGDDFAATFVFVAPQSDRIWRDFGRIEIDGNKPVEAASVKLNPGEIIGNLRMGSITASLSAKPSEVDFNSIEIQWLSGRPPTKVDVGSWKLTWSSDASWDDPLRIKGAIPAVVPHCDPLELTVTNGSAEDQRIVSVGAPAAVALKGDSDGVVVKPKASRLLEVSVECNSPDTDFYVYSPVVASKVESGNTRLSILGYVSVGYHRFSPVEATNLWKTRHV